MSGFQRTITIEMENEAKPLAQKRPVFKAIAAMARNRVIGAQGAIPWRIADELRWFKKVTTGHTIVMGRKTFESLGRPLPNRRNVVLSRRGLPSPVEGVEVVHDLAGLDEPGRFAPEGGEIWVIGGAEIYAALLPRCEELWLTEVPLEPEGDAFFPEFESAFRFEEVALEHPEFTARRYVRRG